MRLILTVSISFTGGVWFALENPSLARQINAYTELGLIWAQSVIGG